MAFTLSHVVVVPSRTSTFAGVSPYSNDAVCVVGDQQLSELSLRSIVVVMSVSCGPSAVANFTFSAAPPAHPSSHKFGGPPVRVELSSFAQRRVKETLQWFDDNLLVYQRGKRGNDVSGKWARLASRSGVSSLPSHVLDGEEQQFVSDAVTIVCKSDCILSARAVVFSTMEDGVGDDVNTEYLVNHFIAPYFLDSRRVVARGEFLLLPFRGGSGTMHEEACTPPRFFWVSSITPAYSSNITEANSFVEHVVAEVGDETCVEVVGVCRGPIYTNAVRLITNVTEDSVLTNNNELEDGSSKGEERSPTPQPQTTPADVTYEIANSVPEPDISQSTTIHLANKNEELTAAAEAEIRLEQRNKAVQEMIRSFYSLQHQWDEERLFTTVTGKVLTQSTSLSTAHYEERDIESATLRQVLHQYKLASQVHDYHGDVIHYLEDAAAHPSRGNVLRLELMSSLRTQYHNASYDHHVLDALKASCRDRLGAIATCAFLTCDEQVAYLTIALSCVPALEDHFQHSHDASQIFIDVSNEALLFTGRSLDDDASTVASSPWSPYTKTWSATLLTTTIVEDLCRRRERSRQDLLKATEESRALSAVKDVVLKRAHVLQELYHAFCTLTATPLINVMPMSLPTSHEHHGDRRQTGSVKGSPTVANNTAWWQEATDRLRQQLLTVEGILPTITALSSLHTHSVPGDDIVTLRDVVDPSDSSPGSGQGKGLSPPPRYAPRKHSTCRRTIFTIA